MLLILKALGVAIFFLIFYRYVDYLGLSRTESTVASILLGISSGFGGIFASIGSMKDSPLFATDLAVPEMTTYYGCLWNPLFPFSLTLILLSIFWIDRGTRDSRMRDIWQAGIASGVLATIHPYFVPMVFAFAIVMTTARTRKAALGYLARYFAAALPLAVYEGLISIFHPIVSKHSALGEMKSPPLPGYLLGFGLPLFLVVAALIIDRGRYAKRYWQIVLWFVLCLALAYLPVWFQRKLIFGAQVPLCIMAGIGVGWLATRYASTTGRRVALSAVAIVLLPVLIATPVRSREFWGTGIEFVLADKDFKRSLDESPYVWRVILEDADKVFENPSVVIYRRRSG